jgi:hypothetical protein
LQQSLDVSGGLQHFVGESLHSVGDSQQDFTVSITGLEVQQESRDSLQQESKLRFSF